MISYWQLVRSWGLVAVCALVAVVMYAGAIALTTWLVWRMTK